MPGYELMVLLKQAARSELSANVRRVAEGLIKEGSVIRRIENMGERKLAYKVRSKSDESHDYANYVVYHMNVHKDKFHDLKDLLDRDQDVLRFGLRQMPDFDAESNFDCVDPMWHQTSPFQR